jgi:hypothetical protein
MKINKPYTKALWLLLGIPSVSALVWLYSVGQLWGFFLLCMGACAAFIGFIQLTLFLSYKAVEESVYGEARGRKES